jgi:hypothetical protein
MIDMLEYLRTLEARADGMAKDLAEKPASTFEDYHRRVGEYRGIREACNELRKLMRLEEYGDEEEGRDSR